MANKYTDILALVNKGNQMGLSNTIKRDYGIPLDFTSVQASYDEAVKYAATSTLAYVGQPIAVNNKLYIITEAAAGKHTVGSGESAVEYDVFLAEVGSATEGDEASITLDNGVLSIAGFKAAEGATLPQKQADGSLKWVGIDAIVEGDGNTKTVVATEESSPISVVKTYDEESDTYTYTLGITLPDVYTKSEADEKFALKSEIPTDYVKSTDYETDKTNTATALGERYTKTEADNKFAVKGEDAYDDTELANRVTQVETELTNVYTKSEVDDAISGMSHFATQVVESTDDMTSDKVLYLVKDETVAGSDIYKEYLVIGGVPTLIGDTTTNLEGYVTDESLATTLTSYATTKALSDHETAAANTYATKDELTQHSNTAASTYATKDELTTGLGGKVDNSTLNNYYTKTEVDNKGYAIATEVEEALEGKADKATTLAGYGITDAYTKTEAMAKTEAYTKAEVDRLLDEVSGGSSETAASVKRALDGYIQNMDTEVYGADVVSKWTVDGVYTPQYTVDDSRIDKALANAATAQAQADKGVEDAARAQGAADAAAAQANTNKADITALTTQITNRNQAVDTEIANLKSADTTINGEIAGLKTTTTNHAATIGEHTTKLATLESRDTEIEASVKANTDNFANYSTTTQMNKAIDDKIAAIPAVDLSDYAKSADVESTYAKIGDAYTKSEADAEFMTQTEVDERINALIVAADPEGGKTITDIQNLVKYVDENAGQITGLVTASENHTTILAGIGGEGEPATVLAAIKAAEYTLPAATLEALGGIKSAAATLDNGVQVSVDGIATVGRVNVNTLVQTEGETIVLNGGQA